MIVSEADVDTVAVTVVVAVSVNPAAGVFVARVSLNRVVGVGVTVDVPGLLGIIGPNVEVAVGVNVEVEEGVGEGVSVAGTGEGVDVAVVCGFAVGSITRTGVGAAGAISTCGVSDSVGASDSADKISQTSALQTSSHMANPNIKIPAFPARL
jgi:hypothetical protein